MGASLTDAQQRFRELSEQWRVRLHRVTETPSSIIGFGRREDLPVVLRCVIGRDEEWHGGAVVKAFAGCGMVRALEFVPGAVLLEEVQPGTPLVNFVQAGRDEAATRIVVDVIKAMLQANPGIVGHPVAADWAAGFDAYLSGGQDVIPTDLVRTARSVYRDLCETQKQVRLLHGDLHHYNVLFDQHHGWIAVDPKGIVAELEFELGAVLRNPQDMPEVCTPAAIHRRVQPFADGLEVEPVRVLGWTFSQAVLCAVWMIEDGQKLQGNEPFLRIARAAQVLMG